MFKNESWSLWKPISRYEFILSTVIWYDIFVKTNIVNKDSWYIYIYTELCTSENVLSRLIVFFEEHRKNNFEIAKLENNILAKSAAISQIFKSTRLLC